MINKILISLSLVVGFGASAATTTLSIPAATITNFPTLMAGSARITQAILQSDSTHEAALSIYDNNYKLLTVTNGSYVSISSYATNASIPYTNYYGYTNNITNLVLIDISVTNAAATNNLSPVFKFYAPTNTTVTFSALSAQFYQGIIITNTGSGTALLTLQYGQ